MFKKSQDKVHGGTINEKKKSVAFKAQNIKNEEENDCKEEELDEEMSLFVKRFNKFMNKKSFGKRGNHQRKIYLLTRHILSVVNWATSS
jgi:hypothetical protein